MGQPQTVERARKRKRNQNAWKRTKFSTLRNSGNEYVDRTGNLHAAKRVTQYVHNCRCGCNNNISYDKCSEIFKDYWALQDWNLQTYFLFNAITTKEVIRKKVNTRNNKKVSI